MPADVNEKGETFKKDIMKAVFITTISICYDIRSFNVILFPNTNKKWMQLKNYTILSIWKGYEAS